MRHEEDGLPRGVLAVGGDVRDDVGEIEVLIFLVVRRIFLHLIGGSFGGVFVHEAALFEGRDDVVARRLVGLRVEERTGAVFGELFDMLRDGGGVHLRLARHFLGIRHGEGEEKDEKRTKYDVDCQDGFFHSSSIGNVRTEKSRACARGGPRKIRGVHKRRFYHMRGGMSIDFTMVRGGEAGGGRKREPRAITTLRHGVGLTTPPSCLWQATVSAAQGERRLGQEISPQWEISKLASGKEPTSSRQGVVVCGALRLPHDLICLPLLFPQNSPCDFCGNPESKKALARPLHRGGYIEEILASHRLARWREPPLSHLSLFI